MANTQVFHAVGKRKSAVARVYLKKGNGQITVNDRELNRYFSSFYCPVVQRPLDLLGLSSAYDVTVNVFGGGVSAQAAACLNGIAKALTLVSATNRSSLKKAGLLTRDSRVVERKKYGHKKARKSFQFSKR